MIESNYDSAASQATEADIASRLKYESQTFYDEKRHRETVLAGAMIFLCLLIFGVLGYFFNQTSMPVPVGMVVGTALFAVLMVPIILWNNPRIGLYIVILSAMTFETFPTRFSEMQWPTQIVPIFWNFNNLGEMYGTSALSPLKFNPAEFIMVFSFLACMVRAIVLREFKLERGAFFGWVAAYIVMVTIGFMRGMTSGGDLTMALWEVRGQFYFFFTYMLAVNLITEKKHVLPILWMSVICTGIKGVIGVWRYFQMGGIVGEQGVLNHDESLFFNILFFILFISFISGSNKKLSWFALIATPAALFTALNNGRRAGIAAFIIAFIPLLPMLWVMLEKRRKQVMTFAVVFFLGAALYLPAAWNSAGAWALPARAIRSNTDPNERDAGSDYYRLAENQNLKFTRDLSPWLGNGYGKQFAMVYEMPGNAQMNDFLKFMPHNSVLWVWMRLGHIGFFCFIMMITTVLIKGNQILRQTQDTLLQTIGCLGVLFFLMLFTFGKYDLQLVQYRAMITAGTFIGILGVLRKLDPNAPDNIAKAEAAVPEQPWHEQPALVNSGMDF